ncbi:hypothetical protein BGZ76_000710 [Entomortierella beljakovae]|nr:hypothetical protein BGZ76_000710 [Entomortierella beljakovae]
MVHRILKRSQYLHYPVFEICTLYESFKVRQNLGLREITVELLSIAMVPAKFWKTVAGLPYLWTLRVYGALISNYIDSDQQDPDSQKPIVEAFMEACRSARVLDFDLTSFITCTPKSGPSPFEDQFSLWNSPSLVFNNITSISYFGRSELDIAFFAHCLTGASQTLRRIKWSTNYLYRYAPSKMAKEVTRVIIEATQKSRPRGLGALESLELWDGEYFTDQEIADILDALPNPLKELSVRESGFEEKAMAALLREPPTIPESEQTSQEILHLEEFESISIEQWFFKETGLS